MEHDEQRARKPYEERAKREKEECGQNSMPNVRKNYRDFGRPVADCRGTTRTGAAFSPLQEPTLHGILERFHPSVSPPVLRSVAGHGEGWFGETDEPPLLGL